MKINERINNKIKEKQKQLKKIQKGYKEWFEKAKRDEEKNFSDDLKLVNMLNPFYKNKYKQNMGRLVVETVMDIKIDEIKREIKELKQLIK